MAQKPRALTPHVSGWHFLGAELRCQRQRCGLSLAQLAAAVFVSADLLARIEKADRVPALEVMQRCDEVLNTGGVLARLFTFVEHHAAIQTRAASLPSAPTVVVRIVTEIVTSGAAEAQELRPAMQPGGARLYLLPSARR
jgi:transcriptional regulator with XRE-family HTH domain